MHGGPTMNNVSSASRIPPYMIGRKTPQEPNTFANILGGDHSSSCVTFYPIPPLGEWDLVFVWFHLRYYYYYYYYPIPPEGEWDLVFVWFHLPYYNCRSSSSSSSKGWSDFTLLLKLSQ